MTDKIDMIGGMISEVVAINNAIIKLKAENEELKKEIANLKWRLHEQD